MNKFIIVGGLPYLLANGKVFSVRWDESGFTVGAEVELDSAPDRTYSEISIKAKCAGNLDSIGKAESNQEVEADQESEAESNQEVDLAEMTLAELKAYAKAHEISFGSARTKDAIIEAIRNAEMRKDEAK